jgi:hypothetical protein
MEVPICAWRLANGQYQGATLDHEGIWWGDVPPLGIGIPDGQPAVYDRAGWCQLREGVVSAYVAELHRRIEELEGR